MFKPPFATLERNFPRRELVSREALFQEIGWDDLIGNSNFQNTCAIRASLALIKSGVPVPGRMRVKAGPFKGARIEPGQVKLSQLLKNYWGKPEQFEGSAASLAGIGERCGIVSFFHVRLDKNDPLGHIDIVSMREGQGLRCANACFWGARTIWFWELA